MQTNYLKIFKTRTKVPSLIYLETVSREDSHSKSIEWEKDILFQQILHKIQMARELDLAEGNQRPDPRPARSKGLRLLSSKEILIKRNTLVETRKPKKKETQTYNKKRPRSMPSMNKRRHR